MTANVDAISEAILAAILEAILETRTSKPYIVRIGAEGAEGVALIHASV